MKGDCPVGALALGQVVCPSAPAEKLGARGLKAQGMFDVQKRGLLQSCSKRKCFWVESKPLEY